MLLKSQRVRSNEDFKQIITKGTRVKWDFGQVNWAVIPEHNWTSGARVGVIVGKKLGNSVYRHKLSSKLKHWAKSWANELPSNISIILQVNPKFAGKNLNLTNVQPNVIISEIYDSYNKR